MAQNSYQLNEGLVPFLRRSLRDNLLDTLRLYCAPILAMAQGQKFGLYLRGSLRDNFISSLRIFCPPLLEAVQNQKIWDVLLRSLRDNFISSVRIFFGAWLRPTTIADHMSSVSSDELVHRSWGWYQRVHITPRFLVVRLMLKPGEKLSLQKRFHHTLHWVIVRGACTTPARPISRSSSSSLDTTSPISRMHPIGTIPPRMNEKVSRHARRSAGSADDREEPAVRGRPRQLSFQELGWQATTPLRH